jgi:hypothetical protein
VASAMETNQEAFVGPLLILSAGRSGSTYVQRILNTCSNAFIFGEHGGALSSLARSVSSIEINSGPQISGADIIINKCSSKQFTAWATPFQEMELHHSIGASLRDLYIAKIPYRNSPTLWGIKEIRYDGSDLQKLLRFFPQVRVIILLRRFADFARSTHRTFWAAKEITSDALQTLLSDYTFLYSSLLCACRSYGIPHQVLHYEEARRDWRTIINTANRLLDPFELDPDMRGGEEAASAFVDYVGPDKRSSADRLQFDRVLNSVLEAGGAQRLHDFEATLEQSQARTANISRDGCPTLAPKPSKMRTALEEKSVRRSFNGVLGRIGKKAFI